MWTYDINFYFDGSSSAHKTNPAEQTREPLVTAWRKPSEGLTKRCIPKGKQTGYRGKVVHLIVAISYNKVKLT